MPKIKKNKNKNKKNSLDSDGFSRFMSLMQIGRVTSKYEYKKRRFSKLYRKYRGPDPYPNPQH